MSRLFFSDISEFSMYLKVQTKCDVYNYRLLKKLTSAVNADFFVKARSADKVECQERLKNLIRYLQKKAKEMPCNKESTRIHMIATAQLLQDACK